VPAAVPAAVIAMSGVLSAAMPFMPSMRRRRAVLALRCRTVPRLLFASAHAITVEPK
jgi:hypothetical protein